MLSLLAFLAGLAAGVTAATMVDLRAGLGVLCVGLIVLSEAADGMQLRLPTTGRLQRLRRLLEPKQLPAGADDPEETW